MPAISPDLMRSKNNMKTRIAVCAAQLPQNFFQSGCAGWLNIPLPQNVTQKILGAQSTQLTQSGNLQPAGNQTMPRILLRQLIEQRRGFSHMPAGTQQGLRITGVFFA